MNRVIAATGLAVLTSLAGSLSPAVAAPPSVANAETAQVTVAGTGNTVGGCTARWWNTAFSSRCWPATISAQFQTTGWCDYEPTAEGPWQFVGDGSYVDGVSSSECTFGVYHAEVNAR